MIDIQGFTINALLLQSKHYTIYRGVRKQDNLNVILKVCHSEQPSFQEISILQNEYQLLSQLNLPQVIKAYELLKYNHQFVLILEDILGISLMQFLAKNMLTLPDFFIIALQLVIVDSIRTALTRVGVITKAGKI